jgi:hypothetical protein
MRYHSTAVSKSPTHLAQVRQPPVWSNGDVATVNDPSSPRNISRGSSCAANPTASAVGAPIITTRRLPRTRNISRSAAIVLRNGDPAILIIGDDTGSSTRPRSSGTVNCSTCETKNGRLRDLANNNSAFDLKHSAAGVWLLGVGLQNLANNNSVRAQVWILEALPPRKPRNLANNNVLVNSLLLPDNRSCSMLTTDQINDLHRLYWSERWPIRKIERHLRMSWRTIKKYLDAPAQAPAQR